MTERDYMEILKKKYRYCASIAFYNSRLFNTHRFKVQEDREIITRAFRSNDDKTLEFYEKFYVDMLKNDRTCEKDLSSRVTFEDDLTRYTTDDALTIADLMHEKRNANADKRVKGFKKSRLLKNTPKHASNTEPT
jgi:hypothetical protein